MSRKSEAAKEKGREYTRAWFKAFGKAYQAKRRTPKNGQRECPACHGIYALRLDGELRIHPCFRPEGSDS